MLDYKYLDNMLTIQTKMTFPFELSFFKDKDWKKTNLILDIGCGNGKYLYELAHSFPKKIFLGTDINANLIAISESRYSLNNLSFIDINNLKNIGKFDAIILRLVLNQAEDREDLILQCYNLLNSEGILYIIDADDELNIIEPNLIHYNKLLIDLRKKLSLNNSGRILKNILPIEIKNKFEIKLNSSYIVNSKLPFYKEQMYLYMLATSMLANKGNYDINILSELWDWYLNEFSHAQYGIFIQKYIKIKLSEETA